MATMNRNWPSTGQSQSSIQSDCGAQQQQQQQQRSPTDPENNNLHPKYIGQSNISPKHNQSPPIISQQSAGNTVSAAADSSDNQPGTPQPTVMATGGSTTVSYDDHQPLPTYHQSGLNIPGDLNAYMTAATNTGTYDPYYHYLPPLDGSIPPPPPPIVPHHQYFSSGTIQQQQQHNEYKTVPSTIRYHPYQIPTTNGTSTGGGSSVSSRDVSSSSPIQNSLMHSTTNVTSANNTTGTSVTHIKTEPGLRMAESPSGGAQKQCDKCGLVCDNSDQLTEHHQTVHGTTDDSSTNETSAVVTGPATSTAGQNYGSYLNIYNIKEERSAGDILDLDSQKMVYPPSDAALMSIQSHGGVPGGPLPPMHSLQAMQRSPMIWSPTVDHHHHTSYMQQSLHHSDKQSIFGGPPPSIKSEYISISGLKADLVTTSLGANQAVIKSEFGQTDLKEFGSEISGNQLTTSPSEFPSTTTPHENGMHYRSFEPATSTLPTPAPATTTNGMKSTTWKSNEARRPKTYNCTACNKWFTSSGHLKRHYNTTLHKNAVKSSGQPDPATMPISVHHHPARDQNKNHGHHHRTSPAHVPPPAPPEQNRSPDYSVSGTGGLDDQYGTSPGSGSLGFQQAGGTTAGLPPPPSFLHHYGTPPPLGVAGGIHQNQAHQVSNHPNGQAGPSVLASQPRGLLIYLSNNNNNNNNGALHTQPAQHHRQSTIITTSIINSNNNNNTIINQQEEMIGQLVGEASTSPIMDQPDQVFTIQALHSPLRPLPPIQSINSISTMGDRRPQHQQSDYSIHNHSNINPIITTTTIIPTNTTIQSYPVIQPVEDQPVTYHTIIGSQMDHRIYDDETTATIMSTDGGMATIKLEYDDEMVGGGGGMDDDSENTMTEYTNQMYVEHSAASSAPVSYSRRFTGGSMAAMTYMDIQPYSPSLPESFTPSLTQIRQLKHQYYQRSDSPHQQAAATGPLSVIMSTGYSQPSSPPTGSPSISSTISPTNQNGGKPTPVQKVTKRQVKKSIPSIAIPSTSFLSIPAQGPIPDQLRCIECDKAFNKPCYLTQHNKTFHSGEKPFKCDRCGKRFATKELHREHFAKHAGDKPFKCAQCPKAFNHKTDLRRHMCLHTGSKPYTCQYCGKAFIRKDHMVKHYDTHRRKSDSRTVSAGRGRKTDVTKLGNVDIDTSTMTSTNGGFNVAQPQCDSNLSDIEVMKEEMSSFELDDDDDDDGDYLECENGNFNKLVIDSM